MKLRFDEVLYGLEQERQRVDEDLRRFAVAAAYLRTLLLPPRRRHVPQRGRCTPLAPVGKTAIRLKVPRQVGCPPPR